MGVSDTHALNEERQSRARNDISTVETAQAEGAHVDPLVQALIDNAKESLQKSEHAGEEQERQETSTGWTSKARAIAAGVQSRHHAKKAEESATMAKRSQRENIEINQDNVERQKLEEEGFKKPEPVDRDDGSSPTSSITVGYTS
ncbi:hypothetical protein PENSPDRAFT_686922 [Peniophora sp. CONT]|nr:hypothetical protein PENSPDRAFT_686922 [Peniophora sp. CONT]